MEFLKLFQVLYFSIYVMHRCLFGMLCLQGEKKNNKEHAFCFQGILYAGNGTIFESTGLYGKVICVLVTGFEIQDIYMYTYIFFRGHKKLAQSPVYKSYTLFECCLSFYSEVLYFRGVIIRYVDLGRVIVHLNQISEQ